MHGFSNGIAYTAPFSTIQAIQKFKNYIWTVHTHCVVAALLDGSKICRPIFDLSMVTVPDKRIAMYRYKCHCSVGRYGEDGDR